MTRTLTLPCTHDNVDPNRAPGEGGERHRLPAFAPCLRDNWRDLPGDVSGLTPCAYTSWARKRRLWRHQEVEQAGGAKGVRYWRVFWQPPTVSNSSDETLRLLPGSLCSTDCVACASELTRPDHPFQCRYTAERGNASPMAQLLTDKQWVTVSGLIGPEKVNNAGWVTPFAPK